MTKTIELENWFREYRGERATWAETEIEVSKYLQILDWMDAYAKFRCAAAESLAEKRGEEIADLQKEITRLKLQYTVAHCWWDDNRQWDSPEEYADECGLKVGDEFTLQASTYWDETFRVTAAPDASHDDYACLQVSEEREQFDTYQEMQQLAEKRGEALRKIVDIVNKFSPGNTFVIRALAESSLQPEPKKGTLNAQT